MKHLLFVLTGLLAVTTVRAQDFSAYQKKTWVDQGDTLRYRLLLPLNYQPGKQYPLVVFLHGSGERGSDNEKQLIHGGALFLNPEYRKQYPAIVVFPQCPSDSSWARARLFIDRDTVRHFQFALNTPPTTPLRLTASLIDHFIRSGQADPSRVYLGGLSLGGFGTFDMLWRYPQYFAAAFPICGAGNPKAVARYDKQTAVWIFHGGKDHTVPYVNSKDMYLAMKRAGMNVKYTLYPDAGHNSWDSAFAEKDLLPWLFSHHRSR
jgi:predicted peptidase